MASPRRQNVAVLLAVMFCLAAAAPVEVLDKAGITAPSTQGVTELISADVAQERRCIVTMSDGNRDWFQEGKPIHTRMKNYAERVGAEFEVVKGAELGLPEGWTTGVDTICKENGPYSCRSDVTPYAKKLLAIHSRIKQGCNKVLWLDDTVIISHSAKDLFAESQGASISAFLEGIPGRCVDTCGEATVEKTKLFLDPMLQEAGLPELKASHYVNSGLMFVDANDENIRNIFDPANMFKHENRRLWANNWPTQSYLAFKMATFGIAPKDFGPNYGHSIKPTDIEDGSADCTLKDFADLKNIKMYHITGVLPPEERKKCLTYLEQRCD